tara:strand:+ start:37274 stop:37609 length:336 start_codon:yes stop_codon:yes gene_type:complete
MRTCEEFNTKYNDYYEQYDGMRIEIPAVISYVDVVFTDLVKIEGFKFYQIETKMGLAKVFTNLEELLPFVGRLIQHELEEKINFILKVEYEIETRLRSLNLDKNGKAIQPV